MAKKTKSSSTVETASPSTFKPEMYEGYDRYKVENAVRTIQEAMALKDDKKLLKVALKMLKEKEADNKEAVDWASNLV